MHVGVLIQPSTMEVCTYVKIANVIKPDNLGGYVRFLRGAEFSLFQQEAAKWPLQHSIALPRWRMI
jgi:hypothetical protein